MAQKKRWCKEQTYCIGQDCEYWRQFGGVDILERQNYKSVEEAVAALNCGLVQCVEYCVVFSLRAQAYYLMWPSEKAWPEISQFIQTALDGFTTRTSVSTNSGTQAPVLGKGQLYRPVKVAAVPAARHTKCDAVEKPPPESTPRRDSVAPRWDPHADADPTKHTKQLVQQLQEQQAELEAVVRETSKSCEVIIAKLRSKSFSSLLSRGLKDPQGLQSSDSLTPKVQVRTVFPSVRIADKHEASAKRFFSSPSGPPVRSCSPIRRQSTMELPLVRGKSVFAASPPREVQRAFSIGPVGMSDDVFLPIEELMLSGPDFDPSLPALKAQLMRKLGVSVHATVEKLPHSSGCFNDGIWMLSNTGTQQLTLKLVRRQQFRTTSASDIEKYMSLQARCPEIAADPSISFPIKIITLKEVAGRLSRDLIVMRTAQGTQLTRHLYNKFHGGQIQALITIFQAFGSFLSRMHHAYKGMQHGDCQASNVFYDETTASFTLIDIVDFGFGPFVAEGGENDVEHFVAGLKSLTQWYGEGLISDCEGHFRAGYMLGAGQRLRNVGSSLSTLFTGATRKEHVDEELKTSVKTCGDAQNAASSATGMGTSQSSKRGSESAKAQQLLADKEKHVDGTTILTRALACTPGLKASQPSRCVSELAKVQQLLVDTERNAEGVNNSMGTASLTPEVTASLSLKCVSEMAKAQQSPIEAEKSASPSFAPDLEASQVSRCVLESAKAQQLLVDKVTDADELINLSKSVTPEFACLSYVPSKEEAQAMHQVVFVGFEEAAVGHEK